MLAFDVSIYEPEETFRRHRHEELQLSLILRGGVTETVAGRTETGRALSVVSKDSGLFHVNHFHRDATKIARLTLPHSIMNDLVEPDRHVSDWRWTHDPRVARPFLSLVRRSQVDSTSSFDVNDPDVLDVLSAFSARPARDSSGEPPQWLQGVMLEMRETWSAKMSVKDVANRAGVHPVYLARCVRRWFGTTLGDELRRLRLCASVAKLTREDATVATIAYEAGYADEPHFCRTARNVLGVTPRTLRSLVAAVM